MSGNFVLSNFKTWQIQRTKFMISHFYNPMQVVANQYQIFNSIVYFMNDSNTFKDIKRPVLLQFSATWCGPCKMLAPIVTQVEQKVKEIADVRRIDVDQESNLSVEFSIRAVPTLILLDKEGSISWRHAGLISEKDLIQQIESLK